MNAIKLLQAQHQSVERLFARLEKTRDRATKKQLFQDLADQLAVHLSLEERLLYPAARAKPTEGELKEAYDEHLETKQLILDGLDSMDRWSFDGAVAALKVAVSHHVEDEEEDFFPKVARLLGAEMLETIGRQMEVAGREDRRFLSTLAVW